MNARHDENRERLLQELLELHFDCHPDPEPLRARLEREPELRALQQEALRTAELLRTAAVPEMAPLPLPEPRPKVTWWSRPWPRTTVIAAAAALFVAAVGVLHFVRSSQQRSARSQLCHLTVSAPQAVPAGAPWSFTVDSLDLEGRPVRSDLRWRAVGADGSELGRGTTTVIGQSVVAMQAGIHVPSWLEVTAVHGGRELTQRLDFVASATPPLLHVTTDRPVYRPGEPVFVRAVALDRVTLQPAVTASQQLYVKVLDPKGAPVFQEGGIALVGPTQQGPQPAGEPQGPTGVAICTWVVPEGSVGGEYTLEVAAWGGALPTERLPLFVRSYQPPRLQKEIVLDRKTYAPGAEGSAEVTAERMGGGAAVGALVRGALVIDGNEVSNEEAALDARGRAVFRFRVPEQVAQGAARFVATVRDGGVVETEVEPFVVPTGEVRVAAFPEGGDLVPGVENRVYLEITDALGRPVDTGGAIADARGSRVAAFTTAHQGRARVAFTPEPGITYRVHVQGLREPLALPPAREDGIALRTLGDGIPAGEPVRIHVAGSGDGPWMVGAFCRGVLVGQATARPDAQGRVDQEVAIEVPAAAAGVLRVTVFDRALRPVAERLVRRLAAQRVEVALQPVHARLSPGTTQQVKVRTTSETGAPIAAAVGLCVVDRGAIEQGQEPGIGLLDQALLFADVERLEDLGDWFRGHEHAERNVDLLLGTRGWRRFVWRNDDAAKTAIAGAGGWAKDQLTREGFAQRPQVASNRGAVEAEVAPYAQAVAASGALLRESAGLALLVVLGWLALEALLAVFARAGRRQPWLLLCGTAAAAIVFVVLTPQTVFFGMRAAGEELAFVRDFDVDRGDAPANLAPPAAAPVPGGIAGFDNFALGAVDNVDPVPLRFFADDKERAGEFFKEKGDAGLVVEELAGEEAKRHRLDDLADRRWRARGRLAQGAGGGGFAGFVDEGREANLRYAVAREYAHKHAASEQRTDFTETVFWHPLLVTDGNGEATVSFDVSDAVTTWQVRADAHGLGRVGQAAAEFASALPFHLEAKLPLEVSAGDRLLLPVAVTYEGGDIAAATVEVEVQGPWSLQGGPRIEVPLQQGQGRHLMPVIVADDRGIATLTLVGRAGRFQDRTARTIPVVARGFPHGRSWGGTVTPQAPARLVVPLPPDAVNGSGRLLLRVFPSPLAGMGQGLQGILQEPHGCFEQASSSNYPNVMVLSYLDATGDDVPAVAARARELLPMGYGRITGYECKQKGYEWFGGDPGHEALTAYGLLQFHDMRKVFDVDAGMVARTKEWLLSRRDGKGGYQRNARALDTFGRAPQPVTDAYVTNALLQTGVAPAELQREIDALAARAVASDDAYELALVAAALAEARHAGASPARQRLAGLQQQDGSLRGSTTSITSSGGDDLAVETTSFALLALLADPAFTGQVRKAAEWLQGKQQASGRFGATQATICGLRALTAYAQQTRGMQAAGRVKVFAGQRQLAEQAFEAGQAEAVEFELWSKLPAGEHELRIELEGGGEAGLPWACDLGYHAELPADDPDAKVAIAARLLEGKVEEGRTVALEVMVQNRTQDGQPMTIAVVGLPAGLELPTSVLEDRKKAGDFDLWEIHGRELALYWRSLAPGAEQRVRLDLVAAIPGTSTGPASRAYLYYTPAQKRWATPLRIEIMAAK